MFRLHATAVFILVIATAAPCAAQLAAPAHIIPVVAKNGGFGGAEWVTSISMSNLSDGTMDVTAAFLRENTPHIIPFVPLETFAMTAGETVTAEDALGIAGQRGFDLVERIELTSYLRQTPPLIRALQRLAGRTLRKSAWGASMYGGSALQICQQNGWTEYLFLVLEKR